jgi:hypothetical protein
MVTMDFMQQEACSMFEWGGAVGSTVNQRRFHYHFGVSPLVCAIIYNRVKNSEHKVVGSRPHHLLWTLCFLKTYVTEGVLATMLHSTEKTVRKWVWKWIDAIHELDVVRIGELLYDVSLSSCLILLCLD